MKTSLRKYLNYLIQVSLEKNKQNTIETINTERRAIRKKIKAKYTDHILILNIFFNKSSGRCYAVDYRNTNEAKPFTIYFYRKKKKNVFMYYSKTKKYFKQPVHLLAGRRVND